MDKKYEELKKRLGTEKLRENVSLADYTSFKIGGPADLFYEAESEEELIKIIGIIREIGIPYFILGAGSNILVGDKGFRGIVIKVQSSKVCPELFESEPEGSSLRVERLVEGFKVQSEGEKFKVYAEAGVKVGVLLDELVKNSITGFEFMAGIPGTIGATVACNAGAWQKSLSETILRVKVLTEAGEIKWFSKDECEFDYRTSCFKGGKDLILAVELELSKGDKNEIEEQVKVNLEKRSIQPKEPSAGSVFINPKPLSAGKLIEECGLKGTQIGGARISEKHANFIVNIGDAKASDVVVLINLAKEKVKEKFNIDLQEEIIRIGEF